MPAPKGSFVTLRGNKKTKPGRHPGKNMIKHINMPKSNYKTAAANREMRDAELFASMGFNWLSSICARRADKIRNGSIDPRNNANLS